MKARFFQSADRFFIYFLPFLVGIVGWAGSVKAKELYFQPSIDVKTEYDTNKRLRTKASIPGIDPSSYGIISSVGAKVGMRSDIYQIALANKYIVNRYISDFNLDSNNINIDLTSNYSFSNRSQFGVNGSYKYDTTLTSALTGTGSGIVQDNIRRKLWTISPTWNYAFSDTQSIQASYSHTDVKYHKSAVGSYSDYTVDNVSTSFQQQWTPLFSNFLTVSAMSFKVPESKSITSNFKTKQDITQYNVSIGGNYQILPTWSASLSGGARFANTKQVLTVLNSSFKQTTSSDTLGFVFSAELEKTFEAGSAKFSFSRSTNPQGQGLLQVRDNLKAYFKHKFTETLQFTLNGSLNNISISGATNNSRARTYYNVSPAVSWSVNQQTSLILGYRYRAQSFKRNKQTAESNSVSLNFNYQWDKIITQRY